MTDLRDEIRETVRPGSMTKDTIIDQLDDDCSEREVKSVLASMLVKGDLEEHPEIEEVYRVSE